jgi:hypothetical protein
LVHEERIRDLQERAVRYFCDRPSNFPNGRPYNCCESVLLALKDYLDASHEVIPKIGTGIGAGVSLNGLLCGSVSSMAIAIGMKFGRSSRRRIRSQFGTWLTSTWQNLRRGLDP